MSTNKPQTAENETENIRKFHVGDILSITSSLVVSPKGMDGIYDILNFMTSDSLFTHQLPDAAGECKPHLSEQFPDLVGTAMQKEIDRLKEMLSKAVQNEKRKKVVDDWIADIAVRFGEYHAVQRLPVGQHEFKNPLGGLL